MNIYNYIKNFNYKSFFIRQIYYTLHPIEHIKYVIKEIKKG